MKQRVKEESDKAKVGKEKSDEGKMRKEKSRK